MPDELSLLGTQTGVEKMQVAFEVVLGSVSFRAWGVSSTSVASMFSGPDTCRTAWNPGLTHAVLI